MNNNSKMKKKNKKSHESSHNFLLQLIKVTDVR